ncbi:MAG TPA: insulinase family protein [Amycolatopsis sp.]|nr:insulinase family protein [Amycolatopsis sp.]
MYSTDIDGVPVFWNERPGPLSATLLFGVGLAHETFLRTGITQLVHHLARTGRYNTNATTEMLHTRFEVRGGPETVADHLRHICESLSNLDTAPLERARGVLAQTEERGPGVTAWLPSSIWFGNQAFGLAGTVRIAPASASAADVRTWAAHWFHRGNAALVLSCPPPANLRLPLRGGRRPPPPLAKPFDLATPAYTAIPNGVVGCALVGWTPALACAAGILTARLHRLAGFAVDHQVVDGRRALLGFGADLPGKQVNRVLDTIRAELADLATTGPSSDELAADRAALRDQLAEPGFAGYRAFDEALSELTGHPSAAAHHQAVLAGIDAAAVAAAARELADGLVLCAPQLRAPGDLPELPGSPLAPVPGRELKRAFVGGQAPRGYRLVAGQDGLTAYYGASPVPVAVVRFDDLAGVGIENTDGRWPILHLFGLQGGMITVRPGDWRGGRALVDEVRARAGTALCFEAPEAMRMFEQS